METNGQLPKQTLFTRLLQIQTMVDKFTKSGRGNNYNYTEGNEVLSEIRPLMNDLGLILKQEVTKVTNTRMDYSTRNGTRSEMFTEVEMLFTWIDCYTGEREECRFFANGMNDWDKGLGSALTYGERYFLLKFFHVPTDKDDPDAQTRPAAQAQQGNRAQGAEKPWINESQFQKVLERIKGGDKPAFTAAKEAFRIKREWLTQLEAAAK